MDRLANPVPSWDTQSKALEDICLRVVKAKADTNKARIGDRYGQLIELIRTHKPQSIIEIGTWNGDRAVRMVQEAMRWRPIVHYEGYDLFETATRDTSAAEFNNKPAVAASAVAAKLNKVKLSYPGFTFALHRGNTKQTLTPSTADFAFIDGGHSIETIAHDLGSLRQCPVIVLDDYYESDEQGRCPDISRFGCNAVLNGDAKTILPIAGRVSGGGLVRMVLLTKKD